MGRCGSAEGRRRSGAFPALTLVLVAWSFCQCQVALADTDAAEGDLDPTDPPVKPVKGVTSTAAPTAAEDAAAGGKGFLERLRIGIGREDSLPFGGPEGGSNDEVLFEASAAHDRFRCKGDSQRLAVETSEIANRRLLFWTARSNGFFEHLVGKEEPELDLKLTSASIEIGPDASSSPLLRAELEEIISETSQLEVGSDYDQAASIKVKYDCRSTGTSMVTLHLTVSSKDKSSTVCLRWKKACSLGWGDLEIKQVPPNGIGSLAAGSKESKVFSGGEFDAEWLKRMTQEGTQKGVTQLQLSSRGIMRLRRPQIESNQRLVSVEALGPLIYADGPSEVGREPVSLTVTYACNFDGFGDVTLLLEKDALLADDQPEKLELRWRKHCGITSYKHLQVYIRSDANKSRVQAVESGEVRNGFVRPCTGLNAHAQVISDCSQKQLTYLVSEKDVRTSLDLEVDEQGVMELPVFDPVPDLTYNGKVLKITTLQSPGKVGSHLKQRHGGSRRKQVLTIKYTCFKDGNSTVTATLHVREHKAIYLSWRKRCTEPKVHTSKALTASQAIIVSMFVLGVLGLAACLVFLISGQIDTDKETKSKGKYRHVDDDGEGDLELPRSKGGAEVVGNMERPGEVTYH
mmetsp:Transcript_62016/g.110278  ORF Transcript_62016/g.110278 Transcript_62016/m.110278 type:complete len:630 (-) Transcript_62016:76-1965(-)